MVDASFQCINPKCQRDCADALDITAACTLDGVDALFAAVCAWCQGCSAHGFSIQYQNRTLRFCAARWHFCDAGHPPTRHLSEYDHVEASCVFADKGKACQVKTITHAQDTLFVSLPLLWFPAPPAVGDVLRYISTTNPVSESRAKYFDHMTMRVNNRNTQYVFCTLALPPVIEVYEEACDVPKPSKVRNNLRLYDPHDCITHFFALRDNLATFMAVSFTGESLSLLT